jgi:hypothetical protein
MTTERQETYVDKRMRQLAEQEAAREATIRRSPPPPAGYTPVQLREFLLKKQRLEGKA